MEHTQIDAEATKNRSEAMVLQFLKERGESSVTELARITGLGKATVSRAVTALRDRGFIEETGGDFRTATAGRAGRAIRLNPASGLYLGLAIGPGLINAVVGDAAKQVRAFVSTKTAASREVEEDVADAIRTAAFALAESGCDASQLRGIGVAIGAPVDPETGLAPASTLVPRWSGLPIRDRLEEHFKLPVFIDNESNCSALAEILWGGAPQDKTIAYLKFDYGVGGALIINGEVRRGFSGNTGEFGHITYDRQGAYCRCGGRGCFENYVSLPAFLDKASSIYGPIGFEDICARLAKGDLAIERVVQETGEIAGDLLNTISHSIDPDLFLLGGNMMALGPVFLDAIRRRYGAYNRKAAPIEIGTAAQVLSDSRRQDEPALGAIGLALKNIKL